MKNFICLGTVCEWVIFVGGGGTEFRSEQIPPESLHEEKSGLILTAYNFFMNLSLAELLVSLLINSCSHSPLFPYTWPFVSTECFALLVHLTNVYFSKSRSRVQLL